MEREITLWLCPEAPALPDAAIDLLLRNGGLSEAALGERLSLLDVAVAASIHVALDRIAKRGWLHYRVGSGVVLIPTSPAFARNLGPTGAPADVLSRFACLRREGDLFILESPLCHARVEVHEAGLLSAVAHPDPVRHPQLTALLTETGFFVERSSEEEGPAETWEFHDLLFHGRSRRGRHRNPMGATRRFGERALPPPPVFPGRRIDLHRPDKATLAATDPPLFTVMEARRSIRGQGTIPLSVDQLAELLFRCLREEDGRRPYPSGGGLYPLATYVAVGACEGLEAGLYHYDPLAHALVDVPGGAGRLLDTCRAGETPAQVLLVLAARFQTVQTKYSSLAYALLQKEVGVLMLSLYLAATAMGIGACALGSGHPDLLADLVGVDMLEEGSVGEMVFGTKPEATALA